ncbi:DNA polymerase iota [Hemicordylus capensis]|uniref:DNA polymerase iota n=1 Tax=Hemicordylus capensis TaxID=884348 RepID=UPI002303B81E|nr:DNA polymerase iota [Hemicordylus capensis]
MEDSGEEEAAEPDWLLPEPPGGGDGRPRPGSLAPGTAPSCHGRVGSTGSTRHRIIVHLDLDCFYAQVEMICNPELRSKPLGVQQKYLVVTCNYEARNLGVRKLMSVKEAKEKCAELVLVNGEDLTKYREMSYKITALLEEFSPLVERLGFDENFVDITEMVELRLEQWERDTIAKISFSGHVYNNQTVNVHDPTHIRLAAGSQIAAEMREAMHNRLGLTGCAGVSSSKLLSKLVSGTFKPNQQTVLLPESRQDLMLSLAHISKVPGIGCKTAKRLVMLGIATVHDLQMCSAAILEKELGVLAAQRVQKLSCGEDDSPVTPSGPPQSLSDEDSFKKCCTEAEVKKKVEELLTNLLDRLYKDGRKPYTIRLAIRQFSCANKWFSRESRQCPIPPHVAQRIGTGDANIKTQLVAILMKLFRKMINVDVPFHLTLLNVCFSNLKAPVLSTKQSIGFYLTRLSPSSGSSKLDCKVEDVNTEPAAPEGQVDTCKIFPGERNAGVIQTSLLTPDFPEQTGVPEFPPHLLPVGIDYDVFNQLPWDIKEEIISSQMADRNTAATALSWTSCSSREECLDKAQDQMKPAPLHSESTHPELSSSALCDVPSSNEKPSQLHSCTPKSLTSQTNYPDAAGNALVTDCAGTADFKRSPPTSSGPSFLQACIQESQMQPSKEAFLDEGWKHDSELVLPPNIDPKTFSELPAEMQRELLAEWKSRDPVSKLRASKAPSKLKRQKKGELPSPQQSNSLLRYFKPN